jgi:hypothetical protein
MNEYRVPTPMSRQNSRSFQGYSRHHLSKIEGPFQALTGVKLVIFLTLNGTGVNGCKWAAVRNSSGRKSVKGFFSSFMNVTKIQGYSLTMLVLQNSENSSIFTTLKN